MILFALILGAGWKSIEYVKSSRNKFINENIKSQANSMQVSLANIISLKQHTIMVMALSIINSKELSNFVVNKKVPKNYYDDLIENIKKNKFYKNVWIQVVDDNLNSIYRSWSENKYDNLSNIRKDLVDVAKTKRPIFSLGVGKYDLSIKAIIPIFSEDRFIGILEVISHFNSISKRLSESNSGSVVLLKKEYKKQLTYPFTKMFIGDYYVANLDAPEKLRDYLEIRNPQNYFNNSYKVENGYLIVSHALDDFNSNTVGYFIMFKKISDITNLDLEFFMFKWMSFATIILMAILIIVITTLLHRNKKQKVYYKNIMDSSTNIILLNDKDSTVDVNDIFFKYFNNYATLDEFKEKNSCICNFFVNEEGYLQKEIGNKYWITYLVESTHGIHKAKMNIFGKEYYFRVSAALVFQEPAYYSIVLTDITTEENYKKKLEYLTVTDFLTGIFNRRFYQQKIEEEINRAKRYEEPLSLIMIDIDFFKKVNDTHGHTVGDEILVEYSKLIKSHLREADTLCRIGGEEFMIIVPHVRVEGAKKTAEKLRKEVESYKNILPVTMSFGVTQYMKGENEEMLYKRVDMALYKAKEDGRNRVVVG